MFWRQKHIRSKVRKSGALSSGAHGVVLYDGLRLASGAEQGRKLRLWLHLEQRAAADLRKGGGGGRRCGTNTGDKVRDWKGCPRCHEKSGQEFSEGVVRDSCGWLRTASFRLWYFHAMAAGLMHRGHWKCLRWEGVDETCRTKNCTYRVSTCAGFPRNKRHGCTPKLMLRGYICSGSNAGHTLCFFVHVHKWCEKGMDWTWAMCSCARV